MRRSRCCCAGSLTESVAAGPTSAAAAAAGDGDERTVVVVAVVGPSGCPAGVDGVAGDVLRCHSCNRLKWLSLSGGGCYCAAAVADAGGGDAMKSS